MQVIALPGLPCIPPLGIGREAERRLERLASVGHLPRPLVTGYEGCRAALVRARLAGLADPLAAHLPVHLARPAFKQRSAFEARIADTLAPVSRAELSDETDWVARLHDIAFRIHGRETRLRCTPIGTEPGYGGTILSYPPAGQVGPSLRRIAQEVASARGNSLVEIAAYVMLACTTVHPFTDGNGRAARILFNLALRGRFPALPYLAIKEITQFAQGDYLIAMNRVHFRQDWEPFFRWLEAILDIHLAIGASGSAA
jgi:prophage maintenance system killer protein